MSNLQLLVALPAMIPGFRFSPTDGELVHYYLNKKNQGSEKSRANVISEVELNKFEPWDLPAVSVMPSNLEWFYYSPRSRRYLKGSQVARTTECGYWKTSGKESNVKFASKIIGKKRALFFFVGSPPRGEKTGWFMHEFSSIDKQKPLVICRLRRTNGEVIDTRLPHFGEEWRINENPNDADEDEGIMLAENDNEMILNSEPVVQIAAAENPLSKPKQVVYYDDDEFYYDSLMTEEFIDLFGDNFPLMPTTATNLPFATYTNEDFEGITNAERAPIETFQIPPQDAAMVDNWYDLQGWQNGEQETGAGEGDSIFLDNMNNINTNMDDGYGQMIVDPSSEIANNPLVLPITSDLSPFLTSTTILPDKLLEPLDFTFEDLL